MTYLGDSLAVELSALTRAALVRIQVPQPTTFQNLFDHFQAVSFLRASCRSLGTARKRVPRFFLTFALNYAYIPSLVLRSFPLFIDPRNDRFHLSFGGNDDPYPFPYAPFRPGKAVLILAKAECRHL